MKPDYSTIEKFREIYLDEFGEEITQKEAYERFLRLVNVLRVIFDMTYAIDEESESVPLDPSLGS
jgi:hypothetical protein